MILQLRCCDGRGDRGSVSVKSYGAVKPTYECRCPEKSDHGHDSQTKYLPERETGGSKGEDEQLFEAV